LKLLSISSPELTQIEHGRYKALVVDGSGNGYLL